MTKEITKAYILQQIQDKFKLRELEPEVFRFSEQVIPTYDVSQHLGNWVVLNATVSITSAASFVFFDVPETERWLLRSYLVIFGGTGAIKGSGLMVNQRPGSSDYIYLDLKKGQEVSYLVNLPVSVVLHPGNELKYLIDTYVSTQNLTVRVDVLKEEIR